MRRFIGLAIWFYLVIIFVVGICALLFLTHRTDLKTSLDVLTYLYSDRKARMVAALATGAVMIISMVFAKIIWGRQEKERSIFIENPLGRVTISVSAIEDLVRRMVVHTPQIREIRPDIISSKRGLKVNIRLILESETNIPQLTADLQELIQAKIQELIGKDEQVLIRIHVTKIASEPLAPKKGRGREDAGAQESPLRFHGYRA